MQFHPIYKEVYGYKNAGETFDGLLRTLKPSVTGWDYFVDWKGVRSNLIDIEISLNLLNYLVGKADLPAAAEDLLKRHPEVISVLPRLIAVRSSELDVLDDYRKAEFYYHHFNFSKSMSVADAVLYLEKSGVFDLLREGKIKSFVDYVLGVEVGLSTNGRKNRGGEAMERLMEHLLGSFCQQASLPPPLKQATPKQIKEAFGRDLSVHKANRKVDFALNLEDRLVLIETNFYSVDGSKLKSTAGEYMGLQEKWRREGHQFIWITDGRGWLSSHKPLRDAYNSMDHIINLDMFQKGVFRALLGV
jgi:type II restriction enzyme